MNSKIQNTKKLKRGTFDKSAPLCTYRRIGQVRTGLSGDELGALPRPAQPSTLLAVLAARPEDPLYFEGNLLSDYHGESRSQRCHVCHRRAKSQSWAAPSPVPWRKLPRRSRVRRWMSAGSCRRQHWSHWGCRAQAGQGSGLRWWRSYGCPGGDWSYHFHRRWCCSYETAAL